MLIALTFFTQAYATSSSLWNAADAKKQKGNIMIDGAQTGRNISYFADMDRTAGHVYHENGHSYIIEHAIRLLREDGYGNWADFAQSYILHLSSGAVHADAYKGRVQIRIQLEVLWGLFSKDLHTFDLTCAGGCEHYHNCDDGTGLNLTGFNIISEAADYLIKILTILGPSNYTFGLVNLDIEIDPDIRNQYDSGADLCVEHFRNAVETWKNGKVQYPGRSEQESAMYELGWACHLMADLTVAQHLYEKFIGGHSDYENFADGKGDLPGYHAKKGDFAKNLANKNWGARQLTENLTKTMFYNHPENFQQAEYGGDKEREKALRLALPLAEQHTAALIASFMREIGIPKNLPPLRGYVSVKGKAEKVPGAFVFYSPINQIEQNVDWTDTWRGWNYVRANNQGFYSIPVTGNTKYWLRPAMPGYSFDGTTDANLEFGKKVCPVEYWQPGGVVDSDMLFFYMDPLPQIKVAVLHLPGQQKTVMAKMPMQNIGIGTRTDFIRSGAQLSKSATKISPALASAISRSLLQAECSQNVIGVHDNDLQLPKETTIYLQLSNLIDASKGSVLVSAVEINNTVDRFRSNWRSSGLPITASGALKASNPDKPQFQTLGHIDSSGFQKLNSQLSKISDARSGVGDRQIFSFIPPSVDGSRTSLLLDNGLVLVPSLQGAEIEVSTVSGPGRLQAQSSLRVKTNEDGRAAFRIRSGSHAGLIRLQFKVIKNPAASKILPTEVLEIHVQPRVKGIDPKTETQIQLESVFLMKIQEAYALSSESGSEKFRTTVQLGKQGLVHESIKTRTDVIQAPQAKPEKIQTQTFDQEKFREAQARTPQKNVIDISGQWRSNVGLVYEISQSEIGFTWRVIDRDQRGEGNITGDSINARWWGALGEGSAVGRIEDINESGVAQKIVWRNGVIFFR